MTNSIYKIVFQLTALKRMKLQKGVCVRKDNNAFDMLSISLLRLYCRFLGAWWDSECESLAVRHVCEILCGRRQVGNGPTTGSCFCSALLGVIILGKKKTWKKRKRLEIATF